MTVEQLIRHLSQMPYDAEIKFRDDDGWLLDINTVNLQSQDIPFEETINTVILESR